MVHRRWHWSATPLRCCGRMLIWPGVNANHQFPSSAEEEGGHGEEATGLGRSNCAAGGSGGRSSRGAQEPEYVDDDGSVHEESLQLLQLVGVIPGSECGPVAICPKDPIDRTMMAVWVIRAQDYVLLADQEPGQPEWEPGGLDPGRGLCETYK